jgi:hypothetical protein
VGGLAPLPEPKPLGQRQNPSEGRCALVVGRLGSGKTSYAVHRAIRLARSWRLPLYANAAIRPDVGVLRDWDDLRRLPLDAVGRHPAVILLDELHLWYPSATGLMPKERLQDAFELISYARKRGWTIFATTQAPTRVHTGYRQVMTELLRVEPVMEGILHKVGSMDPDTGDWILRYCGWFSPRRARYDTRAEVAPLWTAGRRAERTPTDDQPGRPATLPDGHLDGTPAAPWVSPL